MSMDLPQTIDTPSIVLITGLMAAGKSTIAQGLAAQLPNSVHLRGDMFRRMIVNGRAELGFELTVEAQAQLQLRYRIAATVAGMYLESGFTVVYQDIILAADLASAVQNLRQYPLYVVVLCPSVAAIAAREAGRPKSGYGALSIAAFDEVLRNHTPQIGLWLDSSDLTAAATVEQILANLAQARVAG